MTPQPLTDDEIVALLPRLDLKSAMFLATKFAKEENLEVGYHASNGEVIWDANWNRYVFLKKLLEGRPCRITILRPPKRRPLKREELPHRFRFKYEGGGCWTLELLTDWSQEGVEIHATNSDSRWSPDEGKTWHPFYIDEPQPPLVLLSTEEAASSLTTEEGK